LNLLRNLKTERDFFLENRVGKMALFFVHAVEAEKSMELLANGIGANGANIPFMISRTDGLMNLIYRLRNGCGS
jgi:hypothetical protein